MIPRSSVASKSCFPGWLLFATLIALTLAVGAERAFAQTGVAGVSSDPVVTVTAIPSIAKASEGAALPVSAAAISPDLNRRFLGARDITLDGPVNASIGVSSTHVVQAIDRMIQISDRASSAGSVVRFTPDTLFSAFYLANPNYYPPTSPSVAFDHFSRRFVIVWTAASRRLDDTSDDSHYLIQVSRSSDPNQGWNLFTMRSDIDGTVNTATYSESAKLGFDAVNFYITSNQLTPSRAFSHSKIRTMAKYQLYSFPTQPVQFYDHVNVRDAAGGQAFAIQPCVTFGNPTKEFLVSAPRGGAGSALNLFTLTGTWPNATGTPPILTVASVPFNAWTAPTRISQPATTVTIDGGDGRLLNAMFRNDVVYTAHSIRAGGFNCAAGIKGINTLSKTKVLDEVLGAPNEGFAFPAVAVDPSNVVYTVFNRSGSAVYPECRYALKRPTDATFQVSKEFVSGADKFSKFGFGWGNYNGMSVDPAPAGGGVWMTSMACQPDPSLPNPHSYITVIGNVGTAGPVPVGPQVIATYNDLNKTLKLVGDEGNNQINVSYSAGRMTVSTLGPGQVNAKASETFNVTLGKITIDCDLAGGADRVIFTGINGSAMRVLLGTSNDSATFNLCISDTLTLDGGFGTDTYTTISSRFTTKTILNIP